MALKTNGEVNGSFVGFSVARMRECGSEQVKKEFVRVGDLVNMVSKVNGRVPETTRYGTVVIKKSGIIHLEVPTKGPIPEILTSAGILSFAIEENSDNTGIGVWNARLVNGRNEEKTINCRVGLGGVTPPIGDWEASVGMIVYEHNNPVHRDISNDFVKATSAFLRCSQSLPVIICSRE
jgi:hypothetical protein